MNWKDFLKVSTLLFVALFAFAACSSSDDDDKPVAEDAKMLTFGFYQEDNAGILSKDYVVTVPALVDGTTRYSINIAMPSIVDKSALVARFTANEKNAIMVGNTPQISRQTKNDFTAPVDYTVTNSDKTKNVIYTVTITKSANMAWTEGALYNGTEVYSDACMAVSPKDNLPYIAFKIRKDDNNKMSVLKLNGSAWEQVGAEGFSGQVNGSHYAFDIALDGTPYVAYGDQEAESLKGALSVMKFNGSKWDYVGSQGFFKVQAQYVGIAALENGLAVGLQNNSKTADIPQRALGVATWNGSAWTSGESSLLTAGQPMYTAKVGSNGKIATMISINRGAVDGVNYGHNIFKYENGQWESLATNFLESGATQTSIAIGSFGTVVANDGTIYAWTGDDAPNTDKVYQVRLKRYDATAKEWKTVGGNTLPIGHEAGFESHISLDVAIAPDGTPFVAYNNFKDNKKLYVMFLDPDTKQWTTPTKLAEGASDVNIDFSSTGEGYITYTDEENHIHVFKYAEK